MLKRLRLENFKNFKNATLELGRLKEVTKWNEAEEIASIILK